MNDQLPSRISQKRLVRMFKDIKRLQTEENRFCFLIGAGASKSSGIKTGWELSEQWYKEIKKDFEDDKKELDKWEKEIGFDADNVGAFYPYLYQKRYEVSPKVGYEEFKKLMENIEPGIGYVILSQILATEKHNFVITTNFDYLIEDSVRLYTSTKPFTAGHETLAEFISSQTERPTIIKVHRDLFLHPFNDDIETQKLKKEWEKALVPILKNFNLLVVGYGGNDGSLMDYLTNIKAHERNPIYWCIRNEDEINDKITHLLDAKDFIVKIEGFDELMIALNDALDYTVFENLDQPENHPFVSSAKKRISDLNEKLKLLLEGFQDKDGISEETKEIFTGAFKYIIEAYSESDANKTKQIYIDGLDEYPNNISLLVRYAKFLKANGDYDEARKYYKKVIALDPDDADNIGDYALFLHSSTKEYDKAEEFYKKAIELDPDHSNNLGNYALFLESIRENFEEARTFYEKAIDLNPNSPTLLGNYATFLSDILGEYTEAEENFRKTIELNPEHPNNLGNYALFLTDVRKDYSEADEYFKRAIELDPDSPNKLGNYAHHILIAEQDYKKAETLINKSFSLSKTHETELSAELWFYRYSHYKKWYKKGERELSRLISLGVTCPYWNFQAHIDIAKENNHPNLAKLEEFAELLWKQKSLKN